MKKVIFISTNVEVFERVSIDLNGQLTLVLADSPQKAIDLLLGEEASTFEGYIWDDETIPSSPFNKDVSRLQDIIGDEDDEYPHKVRKGISFFGELRESARILKFFGD